jgi:hypothetical protein
MGLTLDTDITTITIAVGGVADTTNDKLLFGTVTKTLNTVATSGTNLTMGGVTGIDWSYSTGKVLTLTKTAGGAFAAADIQTIEKALQFQTSGSATQGNRTFTFAHADAAANVSTTAIETVVVDYLAPVVKLDGVNTNRSATNITTPATATSLDNDASPASVTELNGVSKLQLRVSGVRDGTNEKLVINGVDASPLAGNSGTSTVGGFTWSWTYAGGAFSFVSNSASVVATSVQAAALLQSLSYRNAASASSAGVREFFISATDQSGNTSAESAATMAINNGLAPQLLAVRPVVALDGNNDGIKGDQFVLNFSEDVKTSLITINNLTFTSVGVSWGNSASVTPIDAHTLGGTEYASSFLVNGGTNGNFSFGPNQYVLQFGSGHATMPDSISVDGQLTIESWVFISGLPVQAKVPRIVDLSIGGAGQKNLRMVYFYDGTFGIGYSDEGSPGNHYLGSYTTAPGAITPGRWLHLAATIDTSGTPLLYINGNLVAGSKWGGDTLWDNWSAEFSGAAAKTFTTNYVGHSAYNDGDLFGSLADLRIYSSARTASQIGSDMLGNFDATSLQAAYLMNNSLSSGRGAGYSALALTRVGNVSPQFNFAADTIQISQNNVEDINGNKASSTQSAILKINDSLLSGTKSNRSILGTAGNDYIAGYGGNDTLTGDPVAGSVRGGDTFAWLRGDTGTDTVTDFIVSDGDMINLAGILFGKNLNSSSSADSLARYLNLSQSNADAVLKIEVDGTGIFTAGVEKTITFTNAWANGLDASLSNLVSRKIIVVDYTVRSTPLVLDLNGDGVRTTSMDQGVAFDIQGTGQLSKTGWTDGHDGLLALDLNQDGAINNSTELFGSSTRLADGSQAPDGFVALSQYDINQDGVIDAQDAVFTSLKIWVDGNVDGVSSANELYSLMDLDVQSINLTAVAGSTQDNGNLLSWVSQWTSTDGQTHDLADVLFTNTLLNTEEAMLAFASWKVDLQTQPDDTPYHVQLADVLANNHQICVITGNANDQVTLDNSGWINTQQTVSLNQHTYVLWQNGSANVLVDKQISTHAVL